MLIFFTEETLRDKVPFSVTGCSERALEIGLS